MTASLMSLFSSRWPPESRNGATNQLWPCFLDHQKSGRIAAWPPPSVLVPMKTKGQMRKRLEVGDVVYDEKSHGMTVVVSWVSWSRCQPKNGICTRVSSCLSQLWK